MFRITFVLNLLIFSWISAVLTSAQNNLGFDHQAHAVPGKDKVYYDLEGKGSVNVPLDGSGSHSHYFDQGPPAVSGTIEGFEWVDTNTGKTICNTERCNVPVKVGVTIIALRVWDNTGDTTEDNIKITVHPRSAAKFPPSISSLNPPMGPAKGHNIVSINGANLYHDSVVYIGNKKALDVKHVDQKTIVCTIPPGSGSQDIKVESVKGTSNLLKYTYQESSEIPVHFVKEYWRNADGTVWSLSQITGIVIGKDHRYYMSTRTGYVVVANVNRKLTVQDSCTGAYAGDGRSIAGIGFNPMDPEHRLFISTNTYYFQKAGSKWHNAKIESVYVQDDGCPVLGDVIISGLPVSNHDHGTNKIVFDRNGRMLISVGSTTNAGVSTPGDGMGGIPESPLSAAIVLADYLKPGFNGIIKYNQYRNPGTARVVSGDVEVYAAGLRNCFGMVLHQNGNIYATDNGPNIGFGGTSTACNKDGPDPETKDKLLRIVQGRYYGHPNRNRARYDEIQCTYRNTWEASGNGYLKPIGMMESSTNGIADYRANTFQGVLKGNLFMSKVAFDEDGALWRTELSNDGIWVQAGPYMFKKESGLSLTMGLWGELVMPQIEKSQVLVYRPQENAPAAVQMISVYPERGPKEGGTEIIVTGHHMNQPDVQVLVGGKPCTGIWDVFYDSLKCTTPAGSGKVNVVVKQGEVESASYGFDFEYV